MNPSSPNLHPATPPPASALTVALVGVGGYGQMYARPLLEEGRARGVHFIAAVDSNPNSTACELLKSAPSGPVPIYTSLDALYAHHTIDLTLIVSPIHFHHQQTLRALAAGSHVLVEKPVAATADQALDMLVAQRAAGRSVAVGFQWSFCPVLQSLKRDIASGLFGAPKRLRSLVIWPRDRMYYSRNNWAGKEHITLPDGQTAPVFDSPANNAAAHFLHNMLFLLGGQPTRSADVAAVTAELFRANPIESYDTASIQVTTAGGVPIHFLTSHAASRSIGPLSVYEFEHATIRHAEESPFTATFTKGPLKGQTKTYGRPAHANSMDKLWSVVESLRTNALVACDIETALPHARVISLARQQAPITPVHPSLIRRTPAAITIPGLEEAFESAFEAGSTLVDLAFNKTVLAPPALSPV